MSESIEKAIQAIAHEIELVARAVMSDPALGLSGSAASQSIEVKMSTGANGIVFDILFADYIHFLNAGRKPRTGKQPPIDALRDWALKRNIPTDNSTLYLISRAIWLNGIEPRPILATLEEKLNDMWKKEWADELYKAATHELTKYFN